MDGHSDRQRRQRSELSRTPLDPRKAYKPLDVGNGIVVGTVTPGGRWLSLGITHPVHGRVVLTDMPAFPDERRLDQKAVREYRAALASRSRKGFGLGLLDAEPDEVSLIEGALPLAAHATPDARIEVVTFAPVGRHGGVQVVRVFAAEDEVDVPIDWNGEIRLGRAAFTQLTPGGALPPVRTDPRSGVDGRVLWIDDRELDASAAIALPAPVTVPAGTNLPLVVAIALAMSLDDAVREAVALAADGVALLEADVGDRRRWWSGVGHGDDSAVRRGVTYALDCAAAHVRGGVVAMLADHEILPLVWTRDAYYVCRMLLALAPRDERVREVVDGFIRWLFDVAERPGGWWPRASLASGQAKDPAFQLDQQLWPLLLLEDHARLTGDPSVAARYQAARDSVIDGLLRKRSSFGLIAADETPADDPLAQPFHFSSHVLLWRVLRDVDPRAAEDVRRATRDAFTVDGRFAYAVTAPASSPRHYHDANDLPTVFAPGWGFCHASDPVWRNTVGFAWSNKNEGYFEGELGGLGSLHTRHPWPLGDLQDIVVSRLLRDEARETRAWHRLGDVETWEGLLPEAYDESTGAVASRHWFAWPAALRALLRLDEHLVAP